MLRRMGRASAKPINTTAKSWWVSLRSTHPTQRIITVTNVRQDRSHYALRRPAPPQFDREGDGRGDASHLLFTDPQFQPRFFAGDLRHGRKTDRAGRSFAG